MRLINQTKNTVLAEDVFIARTLLKRVRGLLGKKTFLTDQAIILEPCNSIHTFFMHFPIDVLFLDKNYKIVKALRNFCPNRISLIYWNSVRVVELPAGKLNLTDTQAQDQVQLLSNLS